MAIINEELIFYTLATLMAQVKWTRGSDPTEYRFITVSRRVKLFSDVAAKQQPACFQAEHSSTEGQVTGMPYKTVLEANWIIYQCLGKDPNALPAIENNLILGGIRAALSPNKDDPGFLDRRNTLGGLVYHCYIGGKVFKDPGDVDGQGMMVVPIKLLVP